MPERTLLNQPRFELMASVPLASFPVPACKALAVENASLFGVACGRESKGGRGSESGPHAHATRATRMDVGRTCIACLLVRCVRRSKRRCGSLTVRPPDSGGVGVDFRLAQFTPRSLPFPYPLCLITASDAMPVMDAILLLMVVARAERTVSFVSITSEGVGCVTGWRPLH
jgi:hypothetical protein